MTILKEGQIVTLKAIPEEGWDEECAEMLDVEGVDFADPKSCVVVCIPIKDRAPDDTDGLREVTLDQIKEWKESK